MTSRRSTRHGAKNSNGEKPKSVPALADDSPQSTEEPTQGNPVATPAGAYGKWDALSELGKGGQGVVYLARDTSQFDIERVSQGLASAVRRLVEPMQAAERDAAIRADEAAQRILQFAERESPKYLGRLRSSTSPRIQKISRSDWNG